MDLSFENNPTRGARFRRELRNPSMITVILIVVGVLTIILAPFAPTWVTTARDSFDTIAQQKAMQEASLSPLGAIVQTMGGRR